jgi:hypothetical protein
MSELIDRNKAYLAIEDLKKIHFDRTVVLSKAQKTIMELPTVEPKTGHWIIYTVSPFDGEDVKCSECGQKGCATYWDFCPNCGADMREVTT